MKQILVVTLIVTRYAVGGPRGKHMMFKIRSTCIFGPGTKHGISVLCVVPACTAAYARAQTLGRKRIRDVKL